MAPGQKTYVEKLRHPLWQKRRLEIFNRDKFACTSCGDTESNLQVHHKKYAGDPWDAKNEDLTTLCEHCHFLHTRIAVILPNAIIYKIFKINRGLGEYIAFVFTDSCIRVMTYEKATLMQPAVLQHNVANKLMHALIDFYINDDSNRDNDEG